MGISGGKPTSQLKLELSYIFAFSFIWKSISHSHLTVEYSKDRKPHISLPFYTAVALGRSSFSTKICAEMARLIWGGRMSVHVCVSVCVSPLCWVFSLHSAYSSETEHQRNRVSEQVCVCHRERQRERKCVCMSPLCSLSFTPAFSMFNPSAPKSSVLWAVKQPFQSCVSSPTVTAG